MKVLFASYPHVGLGQGGMFYQIQHTKKSLETLGVEVVEHSFMATDLSGIDICHIFATHSANHKLAELCIKQNIPVIISTVFNSFTKSIFRVLFERKLSIIPGFLNEIRSFRQISNKLECCVALNEQEKDLLISYFPGLKENIAIIPNGVDHKFSNNLIEKDEKSVLCVGTVCPRKNQLNLIKAAQNSSWKLNIVGELDNSKYSLDCINEAKNHPNIELYGRLDYGSDKLIELYRKAKVFCLPSLSEVQPLTIIEAAQNNCNIVTSTQVPVQSFMYHNVHRCIAEDKNDINKKIELALVEECNLKDIMMNQPSWDNVAEMLINLYLKTINN